MTRQKGLQIEKSRLAANLLALSAFALLIPTPSVFAETRLVSPSSDSVLQSAANYTDQGSSGGPREDFPESSFGHQPARQMAAGDFLTPSAGRNADGVSGGGRNPASLVFDSEGNPAPTRTTSSVAHAAPLQPVAVSAPGGFDPAPSGDIVAQAERRGVQEIAVIAADLGYFPKTIFVTRDVPVRLYVTGASNNTLCLMMDSFGVRKQIRSSRIEEITFTPSVPGKYRFYCPVNGIEGTLIVKELANDMPPAGMGGLGRSRVPASAPKEPPAEASEAINIDNSLFR
jgi:hypothetical protein